MANDRLLLSSLYRIISEIFSLMPLDISLVAKNLGLTIFNITRVTSHLNFLNNCLHLKLTPKGFRTQFHPSLGKLTTGELRTLNRLSFDQSVVFMRFAITVHKRHLSELQLSKSNLFRTLHPLTYNNPLAYLLINTIIRYYNKQLYDQLTAHKKDKINRLRRLVRPPATTPTANTTVVCIPPDLPLSPEEHSVLSKGLNFVPLRSDVDHRTIQEDIHSFNRRLRLTFHYKDKLTANPEQNVAQPTSIFHTFRKPRSTWTPPAGASHALDLFTANITHDIKRLSFPRLRRSNLSPSEWRALNGLQKRQDIVIKPADKGGAVVVWKKDLYVEEGLSQLGKSAYYTPRADDPILSHNRTIRTTITRLIRNDLLPTIATSLTISDSDLGQPSFYMLPKIHKIGNPGRPIVSACSCPTEHISEFLDGIFQPLVSSLPSFIKDTTHALATFNSIHLIQGKTYRLFLLDVCSLYTSIPHADGLKALQFYLDRRADLSIPTHALLTLAELVLTLNSFEFKGQYFEQISGVAMGTKMGPSYACLFMGHFEYLIHQQYDGPIPSFYRRYIDDGIGLTDMSEGDLNLFINYVSNFHPSIQFTSQISTTSVNFLDITIKIGHTGLGTSIYYKPTNAHSFLLYSSSHPRNCKDSIPYSQLLRLRRICQDDDDFTDKAHEMVDFFRRRAYPEHILFKALHRISHVTRQQSFHAYPRPAITQPKLILTYHPQVRVVKEIISRHLPILDSDEITRKVFPYGPKVIYRRDKNLKDLLVHSRLPRVSSSFGTSKCLRKVCLTCKYVIQTQTITFPKKTFQIKDSFSCTSRNLIYVIICKRCNLKYVGQTGRRLADRVREHLRDITLENDKPVPNHFNSLGHRGVDDVCVTAIKSCFSDSAARLLMEGHLINSLGCIHPHGINTVTDCRV